MGESLSVALLDTFVAFTAGMIIIPAAFAFGMGDKVAQSGPPLIFEVLPNIFNSMPLGRLWGALFFLFMIFAAMSTVVAAPILWMPRQRHLRLPSAPILHTAPRCYIPRQ